MMQIFPLNKAKASKQNGFTLIEVLIAMTLLAILGVAIYEATARSFTVNFQLTNESNDYISISSSLAALDEDISQIYCPVIGTEQAEGTAQASLFWGPPVRPDGLRRSRFKGTAEKITFVSNSNQRFERDLPQSDMLKVTWEIAGNKNGTYSLYRTTDWDAFNYEDSKLSDHKPQRVPVISNLASGKFSFYKKADKSWLDNWDSEGSFLDKLSRYPDMIFLKLVVPDPTNSANNQTWGSRFIPNISLNLNGQINPAAPPSLDKNAIPNP